MLVERAEGLSYEFLDGVYTLGLSAGASAPDILIEEVIEALKSKYEVTVEEVAHTEENVVFNIPRILRDAEKKQTA